ncbi:MAG TPA: hypothetical protein DIT64_10835 [Verrucomicrobiales bacterium]|nr:hypothetical protein [Verrucomicrobiales bacterium]
MARSLLGSTEQTDDLLCELEWQIASRAESYPIVDLPETRMATATLSSAAGTVIVAVFFHRIDKDQLELDHLCLERKAAPVLNPRTNLAALPLAA